MMSGWRTGSRAWTARVIAGVGLFSIVTAALAEDVPASRARAAAAVATSAAPAATPTTSAPLKVICVNAVQCFSVKAPAAASNAPAPLDLRAPDIHAVFSAAELQQTLEDPDEQLYVQETVQVEGQRQLAPVSIGIMAIPWAILHPTQAWRIFMPVTDAK
jgi:hypothetical protein